MILLICTIERLQINVTTGLTILKVNTKVSFIKKVFDSDHKYSKQLCKWKKNNTNNSSRHTVVYQEILGMRQTSVYFTGVTLPEQNQTNFIVQVSTGWYNPTLNLSWIRKAFSEIWKFALFSSYFSSPFATLLKSLYYVTCKLYQIALKFGALLKYINRAYLRFNFCKNRIELYMIFEISICNLLSRLQTKLPAWTSWKLICTWLNLNSNKEVL